MIVSFFGARNSGKSSLIKSLFPEIDVNFEEPILVRNYLYNNNVIREFSGKTTDLDFIKIKSGWEIDVAVLLLDPTSNDSMQVLKSVENIWSIAPTKVFVVTKAKSATEDFLRKARSFAEEHGGTLFVVDLEDSASLRDLKDFLRDLLGKEMAEKPAQPMPEKAEKVEEAKPSKPAEKERTENIYRFVPKKSPLAYEEFIVRAKRSLEQLDVGLEGLDETDLKILSMCDGYTAVDEIAENIGISVEEVEEKLEKLKQKGFIREIRTVFKRVKS